MGGANIDRSFFERKKIQTLIDRATTGKVTPEELERIGITIRETGRRGADQILRRLWSESRAEVIRRYIYLLDFFEDDDAWIDRLIDIAVSRRDLDEEGRNVFYQSLEELGVDTRTLPLETIPPLGSISAREVIGPILDTGFQGVVRVIVDIFGLDPEFRTGVIEEMASLDDPRITDLLFTLSAIDDPEISSAAVRGLAQVRTTRARGLLTELARFVPDPHLRELADRGGRRLAFLGVPEPATPVIEKPHNVTFHAGCHDSNGILPLVLTFAHGVTSSDLLCMQLHEENGMVAAMVDTDMSPGDLRQRYDELRIDTELVRIPRSLAISLIRDAIARTREQEMYLPPEYYAVRWNLRGEDFPFERHTPRIPPLGRPRRFWFVPEPHSILEHPFFDPMTDCSEETYAMADEWVRKEHEAGRFLSPHEYERFVDRLIDGVFAPRIEKIIDRLIRAAEILAASGRHETLARNALAEATSLEQVREKPHRSPFIRFLALQSLVAARQEVSHGYDYRHEQFPEYD